MDLHPTHAETEVVLYFLGRVAVKSSGFLTLEVHFDWSDATNTLAHDDWSIRLVGTSRAEYAAAYDVAHQIQARWRAHWERDVDHAWTGLLTLLALLSDRTPAQNFGTFARTLPHAFWYQFWTYFARDHATPPQERFMRTAFFAWLHPQALAIPRVERIARDALTAVIAKYPTSGCFARPAMPAILRALNWDIVWDPRAPPHTLRWIVVPRAHPPDVAPGA